MNKKVIRTIEKYDMLSSGDRVVVGVSGGADSMALLTILMSIRNVYQLDIAVAHIEHGIRGQESLDDAEFVRAFCSMHNIEYNCLSIDAANESKEKGIGVEEYSRQVRYNFFASLNPDKIATAHNLSDNVETLVFRLIRGTGLKGACSIPPVRDNIIRPLIEVSGDEIREYCNDKSIEYRIDSTNLYDDYSRNYIRNRILPEFKALNSDYLGALNSFIECANDDYNFIEYESECAFQTCFEDNKLIIAKLKEYHISVIKRVIAKYVSRFSINIDRLHLEKAVELLYKSSKLQLKGDYYIISDKNYLRAANINLKSEKKEYVTQILKISEFDSKGVDFYCDYDKINGDIVIRKRMAGDEITPANRNCTKSLKKLFNELCIPVEKRNDLDVLCDNSGVFGIVGICADERVKTDSSTKNVFTIKFPVED